MPPSPVSYEVELSRLRVAIQRLETRGISSVNVLGRQVSYMNIGDLYERELWLMSQIGKASRGGKIKVTSLRT